MKEPLTLADIYHDKNIPVLTPDRQDRDLRNIIRKVIHKSVCLYYSPWEFKQMFINIDHTKHILGNSLLRDLYWFKIGEIYIFWNRYTHAKLHNTNIRNWLQLLAKRTV